MTISIDPIIARLGPLEIRWYGLFITTAIVVGFVIASREAKRKGIPPGEVFGVMIFAMIGAIVGARLFHVLDNFGYYWHHPHDLFTLQLKGLAIYGGLTGGFGVAIIYARRRKLPFLRFADCGAVAIPIAQFVGKFPNIINGDTWGPPTSLPWAFTYTNPNTLLPRNLLGVPTQPTPVYEQIWVLIVFAILWSLRKRIKTDGVAIMLYATLYSVGRFCISFIRVNNVLLLGLREAQLIALGAIVILVPSMIVLVLRSRARSRRAVLAGSEVDAS